MGRNGALSAHLYDPLLGTVLRPLRQAIINRIPLSKDSEILDLCCGTGDQLMLLARKGFTRLHGLDLSADMLEVARKTTFPISFHLSDATDTPFPDGSFDVIIISLALHEKDPVTRDRVLREAARLLRGDGRLIIADYFIDRRTFFPSKWIITLVERIAGGEHWNNFKDYRQRGAVPKIIPGDVLKITDAQRLISNGFAVWTLEKDPK